MAASAADLVSRSTVKRLDARAVSEFVGDSCTTAPRTFQRDFFTVDDLNLIVPSAVPVLLAAVPGEELYVAGFFVFSVPESFLDGSFEFEVGVVQYFVDIENEFGMISEFFPPVNFRVFYLD